MTRPDHPLAMSWTLLAVLACSPLAGQVAWTQHELLPPESEPAMTYDSARQVVVVYAQSQTWEWYGSGYVRRTAALEPRVGTAVIAYDSARQRTVLFSGVGSTATWEWDGTTWSQAAPAQTPPKRSEIGMAYDAARQRCVLVSNGFTDSETWLWDGTQWTMAASLNARLTVLGWDAGRQRVVATGRVSPGSLDTWEWDGTSWQARGIATPIAVTRAAYDPVRQRLVGISQDVSSDTTLVQEYDGNLWQLRVAAGGTPPALSVPGVAYDAARQQTLVFGGALSATFTLEPARDTWQWNGTSWTRWPKPVPSVRKQHAMVYDSLRRRVLLFGGYGEGHEWNDLWQWGGQQWGKLPAASPPPARVNPALAYDRARDRVVLFGGGRNSTVKNDTWEWDGSQWLSFAPVTSPPAGGNQMTYDAGRQRCVLVTQGSSPQTWEWDGTSWLQRQPATALQALREPALAYDAKRAHIVLFGGDTTSSSSETWEWDGTDWTRRAPASSPPPLWAHAMCYDRARDRVVLTGGYFFGGFPPMLQVNYKTWEWNGTTWFQRENMPAASASRVDHAMAYDEARGTVVVYGGLWDLDPTRSLDDIVLGDTWEYGPVQPAGFVPFGTGCAGSAGTPALAAAPFELPWLGGPFTAALTNLPPGNAAALVLGDSSTQWGALALPFDLSGLGMTGCTLYTSSLVVVPVTNTNGTATWTAAIPEGAALLGQPFYAQGFVVDPPANPLGVIVSNAATATIGGK